MDSAADMLRILLFWAMNASVLAGAGVIAIRLGQRNRLGFWIATLLIYFALISAGLTLFGLFGQIKLYLIGPVSLLPGAYLLFRRLVQNKKTFDIESSDYSDNFLGRAFFWMLFLAVIFLFMQRLWYPDFKHDPLTYQLYLPGQWLAIEKLEIIPTPFGDNSRAYEPSIASLYYLWLMLPLHGDMFAQLGQFPFFILALLSMIGISKRLGVKSPWIYLPALFFLCTPIVFKQGGSAENDLAMTSAFLALIYFILGLKNEKDSGDDILAALSMGLLIGTKFIGLTLLALVSPLILYGLLLIHRQGILSLARVMLWLFLVSIIGGFWYMRNLAMTGNPLYPLEFSLFRKVIFSGAYSAEVMRNWVFHLEGMSAQKELILSILSPVVLVTCIVSIIIGLIIVIRKKAEISILPFSYICALPLLVHLLNWYVVPFQMERFWLPALASAFIIFALVIKFLPAMGYVYLFILVIDLFLRQEFHAIRFWQWPAFGIALILGIFLSGIKAKSKVFIGLTLLTLLFSFIAARGYISSRAEHFQREWEFGGGWNYLDKIEKPLSVAYSGSNVPYPLLGSRLGNKVKYVNINSHSDWKFHDYDEWLRTSEKPVRPDTPEPALYRLEWNIEAWWNNLKEAEVDYLFVTRVGSNALINIAHDRQGWPVESWWAIEHPEVFRLIYKDSFVRIFSINRKAIPRFSETEKQTLARPLDALAVYRKNPEALEKFFPLAEQSAGWIYE